MPLLIFVSRLLAWDSALANSTVQMSNRKKIPWLDLDRHSRWWIKDSVGRVYDPLVYTIPKWPIDYKFFIDLSLVNAWKAYLSYRIRCKIVVGRRRKLIFSFFFCQVKASMIDKVFPFNTHAMQLLTSSHSNLLQKIAVKVSFTASQ